MDEKKNLDAQVINFQMLEFETLQLRSRIQFKCFIEK